MKFAFKESKTPDELQSLFLRLRRRTDTRFHIPIICEGDVFVSNENDDTNPSNSPLKFLVFPEITVGEFMWQVKKKLTPALNPTEAIFFLFGGDTAMPPSRIMSEVYEQCKDSSGFLFVAVMRENVFGLLFSFSSFPSMRVVNHRCVVPLVPHCMHP